MVLLEIGNELRPHYGLSCIFLANKKFENLKLQQKAVKNNKLKSNTQIEETS